MNKKELAKSISTNCGLDIAKSKQVIDILKEVIKEELASGGNISIRKFGKFYLKDKKERNYFNIVLHKVCTASAKTVVSFTPSISLLEGGLDSIVISAPIITPPIFSSELISEEDCGTTIPNSIIKRNDNTKKILLSSFSGNIILPNSLNLGLRHRQSNRQEMSTIRYVGKVSNEILVPHIIDNNQYPLILSPKNGTYILGYNKYGEITGGVTEPILYHALLSLQEIEPQIRILQNISIPIRNRNYGYKPDVAIIWKERNIYIDIEIDEPYDIVSRKPIHYISCSDKLRNAYFVNNGWFVIRFAEEQIVKDLKNVCHIIYNNIALITREKRFMKSNKDSEVERWTYEKAEQMASGYYREKYLGITPQINASDLSSPNYIDDYLAPDHFSFKKPDEDILENQYNLLEDRIKSEIGKQKYLIIKRTSDSYEFVTEKNFVQFLYDNQTCSYGMNVWDIIEEKRYFIPYHDLESYWSTNTILKEIDSKNWASAIYDCIVNCHPIHISYTNNEGQEAERDVSFLTPWYDVAYKDPENRKKYTDLELLSIYSNFIYLDSANRNQFGFFSGYCSYRKELRTFNVSRINYGIVYTCYKPKCEYGNYHIWRQLDEKKDGVLAEILYYHLSTAYKNRLLEKGNLLNALIMQDKLKEAVKLCLSIKENTFVPEAGKTWEEMVIEDINYFISKDNHKEEFEKMRLLLREKGWKI